MAKMTSIGGQALIEGIMMRGPKKSAMAVRNPQGEIIVEECETKGKDADIAICDADFEIRRTILGGRTIYTA